ncbi:MULTISPECIES: gamma-glutamyltransferase [Roseobacteraceae]|uniref:gamma-glutamyltransferase family protein n=1 Tax=Roseobacteraceae TaxID=2854170 RepID=UPI003297E923
MLTAALGYNGAISAPHRAAALAGQHVLSEGGSAIEAMVAAAATIAVVYPHMNGIGGDGFWLIRQPGAAPIGVFAGGRAAAMATPDWYAKRGHSDTIPARGAPAALTVPGTIAGWETALSLVDDPLPLSRLMEPAISYAHDGIAVTGNQSRTTTEKLDGLVDVPGFAQHFLEGGTVPAPGARLKQPALGQTLKQIAQHGTRAFYEGDIARAHDAFLTAQGSPLRGADFAAQHAPTVKPLMLETHWGRLWNMTPPTQGVSSLMILGIYDRLARATGESFAHVHGLIEATKQAFILRNAELGDPTGMATDAQDWLTPDKLDALAARVDPTRALPWPHDPKAGDTVYMAASDAAGTTVSFIQSVFWEFGSGLTCPDTGVFFQNRGAGFSLAPGPNQLTPGRVPFHTLNPAMAELNDGRIMAYGTMGGEGQPQTQAAVFTRYADHGMDLQRAIDAPRWLLGKTWGDNTTSLKLERRMDPDLVAALRQAGHAVEMVPEYSDLAGHAGAVVRHPSGLLEAASDPRADGAALSF